MKILSHKSKWDVFMAMVNSVFKNSLDSLLLKVMSTLSMVPDDREW